MNPLFRPSMLLALVICAASTGAAEPGKVALEQAIACALVDAGTRVAVNVPASGVTGVFDRFCSLSSREPLYSYNEETAYTVAHGAALGGARSAAILKSHGLAKAANSVIDSITAGTNAGLVVLVFDDRTGRRSDTVFDSHPFLDGIRIPHVTPAPENTYAEILRAFETSEELKVPVAVLIDSDNLEAEVPLERTRARVTSIPYVRDIHQHLLCPLLADHQHRLLEARLARKPPPAERPPLPSVPDGLPPRYRVTAMSYAPVFDVFKRIRGGDAVVTGDTGTSTFFAFPPYDCVDITTCYGGSIPLAAGFHLAGRRNVWAVTGDYAFIAAGNLGLSEALTRRLPLKVLIFHNGAASATGGQPIAPGVFEHVLGGYREYVRHVSSTADARELEQVFTEARDSDRLEIIVVEVR